MLQGKIRKLTDKGYGFIEIAGMESLFFHASALEGVQYADLREGDRVVFSRGEGPKGPRAEHVRRG